MRGSGRLRVLIVGGGIAGLTAALAASMDGHEVTVATKSTLDDTATARAQGGIAAVLDEGDARDSVASHVCDTLAAGAGLGDRRAVEVLCESADARIRDLVALGARFDRVPSASDDRPGELARGLEAAHAHPRILHAFGDATGRELQRALSSSVRAAADRGELRLLEHHFLVELAQVAQGAQEAQEPAPRQPEPEVSAASRVVGAWLQGRDQADGTAPRLFAADAVVLATGGAGQLFAHTSNPEVATGDGIAAAWRAGAAVADLEFVQFHPTVLAGSGGALISEAVRGEGAVLRNEAGERFLLGVHPDAELAPRDVVARAIADEMAKQGGRPVRLDARHLGRAFLERRFPSITARIDESGIDWSSETVPVTPAAHYLMGGVVTDLDGRTSIPGLYAAGETARTGVHGANRLASNSLLEGAVFGRRVAEALAADAGAATAAAAAAATAPAPTTAAALNPRTVQQECNMRRARPSTADSRRICTPTGHTLANDAVPTFSRAALQDLMWASAGLHREGTTLENVGRTIDAWAASRHQPGAHTQAHTHPRTQATTVADREDDNLLLLARLTVAAARARTASLGAHFRVDEPVWRAGPPVSHSKSPLPQKAMVL